MSVRSPVSEGEVLAGKYRVERVLGAGAMGVVVAAQHLQLGERVALKFLLPEAMANPEIVARFAREARAAARIKSEHVARVTDVGTLESGAPYLVMEYLAGTDLAGVLKERGALSVEDAAEYVLEACEAVGEAHSLGIVHRDLKPANLFLARRPDGSTCVKVLDFGISKAGGVAGGDLAMTSTQAMMGSPLYMSPEQMLSTKDVDARSDVWALGVILYELLTGRPPFSGETLAQLTIRIAQEPPVLPRTLRPDLPARLQSLVLSCLEKDRGRRLANVGELAVVLAEYAPRRARVSAERVSRMLSSAGMAGSALVVPPSSDPEPTADSPAAGSTGVAWAETRPGAGRGRAGWVAAAVAIAGAAAGAVWAGTRSPVAVEAPTSAAAPAAPPAVPAPVAPAPVPAAPAVANPAPVSTAPEPKASAVVTAAALAPRAPAPRRPAPPVRAASPPPPAAPPAAARPPPVPARAKGFDFGDRN